MEPKILITDDHSMIRKGIKLLLQLHLGLTDISEACNCAELMSELKRKAYTHLILDIVLSDGTALEVIPNIRKLYPSLHIMIFSMQSAEIYSSALKQYGINYYLPKDSSEADSITFLKKFFNDEVLTTEVKKANKNPFINLSARELEILHYLLKGMGTKSIADNLNIKMNTVSTVKNRIFEKTNIHNMKELIELATLYNINY
ncbi:MAG: response regulator transcription factor [Bacteroidetes bacterium]|nr:response regulator transcription factor [Bacteroidota bacterium]